MMQKFLLIMATVACISGCEPREGIHNIGEFLPESERFWEVIPREAFVERIGIAFELTEGPTWHPEGYLLVSDVPANKIYKWTGKKFTEFRNPSSHAIGLLAEPDGTVLACERGSRSLTSFSPEGELRVLVDRYKGKKLNGPNDLCMASTGAVFFTDPPLGLLQENEDSGKELPYNGVFRWHMGEITLIDSTLSWPNGIALSPDEKFLYVANFEIIRVNGGDQYQVFWMRYTLDETDHIVDKTIFFTASDTSLPGGPDGMKIDKRGNLYLTGPGGILVVDPEGNLLGTIGIPIPASNLAFGPKEKELYITAGPTVVRIVL